MMCVMIYISIFFFFKQKTAYEMRISDWSSDVCSSDLGPDHQPAGRIEDGSEHAAAAVGDGDRHAPVVRRLAAGARARRQSVARGRQGLGAQAGRGAAMSYQNYVIAAYLVFAVVRSEEHTSELQSLMRISYAVFCLKKKKKTT